MIGVGDFKADIDTIANVNQALRSGRISYGPFSKQFEREFSYAHYNEFGVLSNSGTSSLLVALQTLKEIHNWNDGDEVIVPASTFVATVNIVLQCGLKPVLVDVDPIHYLLDIDKLEDVYTDKTRAIIPVHLFGQPVNMHDLLAWASKLGLLVIEDSCECCGIEDIARADITCFSFYVAHIIAIGVGGMAITNNAAYATRMRSLVNHGRDNIYISKDDSSVSDRLQEVIGKRFKFHHVGHSFRITELESAIGVAQLAQLKKWIEQRRTNAQFLIALLKGLDTGLQLPSERVEGRHAWMMFPLVCKTVWEKEQLCLYLEEHGIETREALPLVTQPVYSSWVHPMSYPNAYRLALKGFYVGCHQYLTLEDLTYIAHTIARYYGEL